MEKLMSLLVEENLIVVLFIPCIHLHGLTIKTKDIEVWYFSNFLLSVISEKLKKLRKTASKTSESKREREQWM